MTITVRFFASLRERLGYTEAEVHMSPALTVDDVWKQSTGDIPRPENVLTAVNQEYVSFNHSVQDGDEVAFFPPVTGG